MQRFLDTLSLIRVLNCVMAAVGVWVGSWLTWLEPTYFATAMTAAATFLVCAGGNVVNDLVDVNVDRLNRPDRVLVRGAVSRVYATGLAIGCNIAAIMAAVLVNWPVTIIVGVAIALLFAYNFFLKNVPIAGNLTIALLGAMTFLAGGLAVDRVLTWELPGPLIPASFALVYHLVRELVKDAQDIEGDGRAGAGSLPLAVGVRPALTVALLLFVLLILMTMAPIFAGWYGNYYKIITVYVIDLPTLALLIFIWGNPTRKMLAAGSLVLKVGMALGVVALLLA